MSARARILPLAVALFASACGVNVTRGGGNDSGPTATACTSDLDCALTDHCDLPSNTCQPGPGPAVDAGPCTRDEDCAKGLVCVKSTGVCVMPTPVDAGDYDAGTPPACAPGLEVSCGVSKLGECRLGISRCDPTDAGSYAFGPCVGEVDPTPEICDGKDNNCNGLADEGLPDLSCGVGACLRTVPGCVNGLPNTCTPGLGQPETCDGLDNDCNGLIDDGLPPTASCGVGVCARSIAACVVGVPQACMPGSPGAEVCNGRDDDCNGLVDDGFGVTTCGQGACQRSIQTCVGGQLQTCTPGLGSAEICNAVDDDCNGLVDDGLGAVSCGVGACARTVPRCIGGTLQTCTPGTPTVEVCDGLDNNCNGSVDEGLGSISCGVGACARTVLACAGGVPQTCTPGAPTAEVCDGRDNNCNGQTDEGFGLVTCGVGICQRTVNSCVSGIAQTCVPGTPGPTELCNGVDDNCNGVVDEGCLCTDGQSRNCYSGPAGTNNVGRCHGSTQLCSGGAWPATCAGEVLPGTEVCNGVDDDCNGATDEGLGNISCGLGACARTVAACSGGTAQSCTPGVPVPEVCNGIDDNCNGIVDDGLGVASCGTGACARSVPTCAGGVPQTCVPGAPSPEVCDNVDNNCNGVVDDGLGTLSCGVGACARTTPACNGGVTMTCIPGNPSAEVCNGVDDNCNGVVDDGLGSKTCGVGACLRTVSACSGGVSQTCTPGSPQAETCNGLDDDCNGVVDNGVCGPVGVCPGNQTVNPNTTVTLNTNASSPVGRPVTCNWTVVSRPSTANGTFTNGTSCTSAQYFADVVGTHQLRFTVTDSAGLTSSCDVSITVNPLGDLWVELTWSVPNDMDLHLLHPLAGSSHVASSWHTQPYDCDYLNKTPSWDAPGTADDPSLDRDDIPGQGPENTRINVPNTTHLYTIGVHMFSWLASPTPVTATVRLYCGGALVTTQSRTFATVKDMWVVGTVQFNGGPSCVFTPDGYVLNAP